MATIVEGVFQVIPKGERTLEEIAESIHKILDRQERDIWELGKELSEARKKHPGKREFGRWCSTNFVERLSKQSMLNARLTYETFGDRREQVQDVPQSALQLLAQPKAKDVREEVLAALQNDPPDNWAKAAKEEIEERLPENETDPDEKARKNRLSLIKRINNLSEHDLRIIFRTIEGRIRAIEATK